MLPPTPSDPCAGALPGPCPPEFASRFGLPDPGGPEGEIHPSGWVAAVAALVAGRGRPSWDEYFMATAFLLASRSPCERLHVGCVLVSGGDHPHRLVAAGYNGFLPGTSHRSRVRDNHEQATVHAEQNALADAARRGVAVAGTTAFITHYPCLTCAKLLASAGVRVIKYHRDYRNDELVPEILAEAGVSIVQL